MKFDVKIWRNYVVVFWLKEFKNISSLKLITSKSNIYFTCLINYLFDLKKPKTNKIVLLNDNSWTKLILKELKF